MDSLSPQAATIEIDNVPLYTPAAWKQGFSYLHFSDLMVTYDRAQNALMTQAIGVDQVFHHPSAIALGVLKDVGWNIPTAQVPGRRSPPPPPMPPATPTPG